MFGDKAMSYKNLQSLISRRNIMRGLAAVPLIGIAATTAQAAKLSQKSVAYQESPKGSQSCDTCKLFQAPNACAQVNGNINPHGWCNIWVGKA